ncbi:MAG: hypothetical protein ACJAUE_002760 [Alcanivorax sp.]|jgi:hypothetical protein
MLKQVEENLIPGLSGNAAFLISQPLGTDVVVTR